MDHSNLRKSQEAHRYFYARLYEAMHPAATPIPLERKQILTGLYSELAEIESRLHAIEACFGCKQNFNPNQPRIPAGNSNGGDWAGGANSEGVTAADRKNPRFKGMNNTQIKKQKFVDAHLAAAQAAADKLGVPVANILGVSALESGWGIKHFAVAGNNFFGQHSPMPY